MSDWQSMQFSRAECSRQQITIQIARALVAAGAVRHPRDEYAQTPLQLAEVQHGAGAPIMEPIRTLLGIDECAEAATAIPRAMVSPASDLSEQPLLSDGTSSVWIYEGEDVSSDEESSSSDDGEECVGDKIFDFESGEYRWRSDGRER